MGYDSVVKKKPLPCPGQGTRLVPGSVPGWGRCERRLINVSLSHRCFSPSLSPALPFSLRLMNVSSGKDQKKERDTAICKNMDDFLLW